MTHADIYTKFMIEYDKANVTSSYPSLTKYEIATILNKAYLTLIAGKVSGNNFRKSTLETDTKSATDIQPLIHIKRLTHPTETLTKNELQYKIGDDVIFVLSALWGTRVTYILTRTVADKYRQNDVNYPWINNPVCYLQNNSIFVLYDPDTNKEVAKNTTMDITFVDQPAKFTKDFDGEFELADYMAEELINLAIMFASENTQSTRFQTISQIAPIES